MQELWRLIDKFPQKFNNHQYQFNSYNFNFDWHSPVFFSCLTLTFYIQNIFLNLLTFLSRFLSVKKSGGQGSRLKSLQSAYKNVVLEQGKNSSEVRSLAAQIKALNSDIKENKDKLNAAEKATSQLGDEMNNTKNHSSKLSQGFTVMKGVVSNLASDAIKRLGREVVDLAKSVVTVGLNFESAFAGTRKTVDATEEEFEQFVGAFIC